MSLGELFIELGVAGDVEPLKKAREEMKKAQKEAQRLVKFIQDYNKATSDTEKKLIKENHERAINIDKLDEQIKAHEALAGKVAGFIKGAAAIVTAVTGAVFAINHMTDALFRQNQVWINLLRQTDTGLSTFQKYAGVASVLDKSLGMEGAAGSIEALNEKLFQLALTGEGANGFLLAGINPLGQTPEGIMEQLRARVSGMSDTSATYLLKQMGIDPRMLAMLRLSKEEFEALNAEIKKYQLTAKQRTDIQKYQEEIAKVSMKLQYLKDRALLAILPAWTKFAQAMTIIITDFAKLVNWVNKADNAFSFIIKTVLLITTAVYGLMAALTLLAAHPVIASILAVIAVLEVLYLIIEDIIGFVQGKASVLGVIIQAMQDILGLSNEILNSKESPQWLKDLVFVMQNVNKLNKSVVTPEKLNEEMPKENPVAGAAIDAMTYDTTFPSMIGDDDHFWSMFGMRMYSKLKGNSTTNNTDNRSINQDISINTNMPTEAITASLQQANIYFMEV